MAIVAKETLAQLLTLEQTDDDRFRALLNEANFQGEIFGGQYLGQSLAAAMATVEGRVPHTLYGFFLRAARADRPLDFVVERTRQGRSFTHRRVTALQDGREVFRAEVSLHQQVEGQPAHQSRMPDVPDPSGLRSLDSLALDHAEWLGPLTVTKLCQKSLFKIYPVDPEIGMGKPADEPRGRYWVKADVPDMVAGGLHYAALAYLSDVMANMASRIIHVANAYDGSVGALSLNHGIWFHDRPRIADWLLFDVESCFAGGGIGTNRGLIYGRDSALYASTMQDAMIRRS